MPSSLRFVDQISATPAIRLELNDLTVWRLHVDGTEFPPPPLRRAVASTLLADGAQIPASAYDLRTVRLVLSVAGATADAVAASLQTLFRELDRPVNILSWQQETTNPVFFRTFRTAADKVQDLGFTDGRRKLLAVDVLAEPFALGLPETLAQVTVSGDPAAATNPMYWDVSGIKGDVAAPTRIYTTTGAFLNETVIVAMRRRGDPAEVPFLLQAEAMDQGTDTTTQANDAAMSGSGNNYSRCTFATATLATRLDKDNWPVTPSVGARGTYRVYGRFRKSVSGDTIKVNLRLGNIGGGVPVYTMAAVTLPSGTTAKMVDLGMIRIPVGSDPVNDGPSGTPLKAVGPWVELQAERTAGTGNLDIDYLLFIPADDRLAVLKFGNDSVPNRYVLDSFNDLAYPALLSGSEMRVDGSADSFTLGDLPTVAPGVTNRIYLIRAVDSPTGSPVSLTTDLVLTYWPAYLHIRPAST